MRNALATKNLVAVSAARREAVLNAWQECDRALLCSLESGLDLSPGREPSRGQDGFEEPAEAPRACQTARGVLAFERAQPQHFAILAAYGLGEVVSEALGAGFRHTITPLSGDLDAGRSNPSFTLAQAWAGVMKRRFASCFVDRLTATFSRGEWCSLKAALVATGRAESNLAEDELVADRSTSTLTLSQAVQGGTPEERLASVHRVRAELSTGEWHDVEAVSASGDDPARVTISAPGGSGECRWRVLYAPRETEPWLSFPQPVAESPLHISQVSLSVGGRWDGAEVRGGRALNAELRRLDWALDNHFELSAAAGCPGYAGLALRGRREQKLTLTRDMRCGSLQHALGHALGTDEPFCLQVIAEGAEFAPGLGFRVELIWPRLVLLACTPGAKGVRLTEEAACLPLEGEGVPSVICRVTNAQAAYAGE